MSHTRPSGTGWVAGQQGEPVEIQADPPGDGIGPDHTPPDRVPGQDPKEYRRLERDHRTTVKEAGGTYDGDAQPELFESAEEPATPHPFSDARATEPQDPATEVRPDDPREGRAAR